MKNLIGKIIFGLYALGTLGYAVYSNLWLGTRIFDVATKLRPEAYHPDFLIGQYVMMDWFVMFLLPVMVVVMVLLALADGEE